MIRRIAVTFAFLISAAAPLCAANHQIAAAEQPEQGFRIPRIAQNQARPPVRRAGTITPTLAQDPDGPGPGNGGATNCYSDKSCRTKQGNQCKPMTSLKCYEWPSGDGAQKCAACN
jgi:hypothetical protein